MANVVWAVDVASAVQTKRMPGPVWAAPHAFKIVPTERMTLHVLHCCALIVDALLRCLETWEVAAGDHHLDRTVDLLLAWVLRSTAVRSARSWKTGLCLRGAWKAIRCTRLLWRRIEVAAWVPRRPWRRGNCRSALPRSRWRT